MQVIDTTSAIDYTDPSSIESYWNDKLVETLYFGPKIVSWVEANYKALEARINSSLDTAEQMESLFYMFARIDFPVRTGYVFGYLAVRRYLEDLGLQTKDIIGIDWRRVLRAQ